MDKKLAGALTLDLRTRGTRRVSGAGAWREARGRGIGRGAGADAPGSRPGCGRAGGSTRLCTQTRDMSDNDTESEGEGEERTERLADLDKTFGHHASQQTTLVSMAAGMGRMGLVRAYEISPICSLSTKTRGNTRTSVYDDDDVMAVWYSYQRSRRSRTQSGGCEQANTRTARETT